MSAVAGPSSSKKSSKSSKAKAVRPPTPSEVDSGSDNESDASADSDDLDSGAISVPTSASAAASSSRRADSRGRSLARYQPPAGMEPVNVSVSFGSSPFEYAALARKAGVELWAIRLPGDFKPSRLASLSVEAGGDVRGELVSHGKSYALTPAEEGDGGAEMAGLTLLVPNVGAGGKLQRAPVKIARRLILAPRAAGSKTDEDAYVAPAKIRRTQPANLKFRNCTVGFATPGPGAESSAAAAAAAASLPPVSPKKKSKEGKEKEPKDKDGKRKKRKSEGGDASPSKKKKRTDE
ncbi:hypothetical protein Q8F55_006483 [Vanrija albida]|uniref:DNA-directed RNA polymerase I subunit RPA34 n=1 Tax=Vanrija albida TaxID=181172 RepID=A0ABR3PX96_9TREE